PSNASSRCFHEPSTTGVNPLTSQPLYVLLPSHSVGACPIEAKVLDEHLVGGGCQRRSLHGERKNQRHRGQDRGGDPPRHTSMHRSPFVPWSSADDTARDAIGVEAGKKDRRFLSEGRGTVDAGRPNGLWTGC